MNLGMIRWHIWPLFNLTTTLQKSQDHTRLYYSVCPNQCPAWIVSAADFLWHEYHIDIDNLPILWWHHCCAHPSRIIKISHHLKHSLTVSNQITCSRLTSLQFDTWVIGVIVKIGILQGNKPGQRIRRHLCSTHMNGQTYKRNLTGSWDLLTIYKEAAIKISKSLLELYLEICLVINNNLDKFDLFLESVYNQASKTPIKTVAQIYQIFPLTRSNVLAFKAL